MGQEQSRMSAEDVYRAFPILRFPQALGAGLRPGVLLLAAAFLVVLTPLIGAMISSGVSFVEFYRLEKPEESDLFAPIPGDSRQLLPGGGLPQTFWFAVCCGVSQIPRLNGDAAIYGFIATLVFSVFQVASARILGVYFCRGQSCSVFKAVRESGLQWSSVVSGLVLTVVLMGATVLVARFLVPLLGPLKSWEVVSSSLEYTVDGIALLILSVLLVAYLLGLAGIGIDGISGTEAISRGLSYCLSNPIRILLYAFALMFVTRIAALLTGAFLLVAYKAFSDPTQYLAKWNSAPFFPVEVIRMSLFSCGISWMYLQLREQTDGAEINEMRAGAGNRMPRV